MGFREPNRSPVGADYRLVSNLEGSDRETERARAFVRVRSGTVKTTVKVDGYAVGQAGAVGSKASASNTTTKRTPR